MSVRREMNAIAIYNVDLIFEKLTWKSRDLVVVPEGPEGEMLLSASGGATSRPDKI